MLTLRKILEKKDSCPGLSSETFYHKYSNTTGAALIDVRSAEDYQMAHLEGAISLPISLSEFEKKMEGLDMNRHFFFYCEDGRRSQLFCEAMTALGFENVFMLEGGIGNTLAQN